MTALTVVPHAGVASMPNTNGLSSSEILIRTELGVPAVTDVGSVPRDTVKVSSSSSVSWFVEIVPVPLVWPEAIVMEVSVPTSPGSAVFGDAVETVSGIVTALERAADSRAVTVTGEPSVTGFGETDSRTVGVDCAAWRVMVTV